jgi:RNA polymerase sigma-70 factor (ECF subfamily)
LSAEPAGAEPARPADWTEAYELGRRTWPHVHLDLADLLHHVEALGLDGPGDLHVQDLYLVAAVLNRDERALAVLEQTQLAPARSSIERVHRSADFVDDVLQELRLKLLLGPAPRLGAYRGRSPLTGWIKVTAVRLAYDLARAGVFRRREVRDAPLEEVAAQAIDADLVLLKTSLGPRFQEALSAALDGLAARDRTVLRLHLIERLSIDQIARPYGVHRATVARWLKEVRDRIVTEVHARLLGAGGPSSSVIDSLGRLVVSQLRLGLESRGGSRAR